MRESDQSFLQELARIDYHAIALGKLAGEQGQTRDVRILGLRMARESKENLQQLQQLGASHGVMLPARLGKAAQEEIKPLEERRGDLFDQLFVIAAMRLQQEAIELYEKTALGRGEESIRAWARQKLPGARKSLSSLRESYPEAIGELISPQTGVENR